MHINLGSEEILGEKLGMTRSASGKHIQASNTLETNLQSVTGKGHKIQDGLELLQSAHIKKQLTRQSKNVLDELYLLNHVRSTNDYLRDLPTTPAKKIIACFAEQQTHGKGRQGKLWVSPFGSNIYYSQLWYFAKGRGEIAGLSLAVAVAVTHALKKYGIDEFIGVKWPNDVLWKNKKLAGILLEMVVEPQGYCRVVIGIGLNIRLNAEQAKTIEQPWTCLEEIIQKKVYRNRLAGLLLNELILSLQLFQEEGLAPFLEAWKKVDILKDKSITLYTPHNEVHGIMQGISPRGELILLQPGNHKKSFYLSGEVSLRPIL